MLTAMNRLFKYLPPLVHLLALFLNLIVYAIKRYIHILIFHMCIRLVIESLSVHFRLLDF